jgi:hypothetical protein
MGDTAHQILVGHENKKYQSESGASGNRELAGYCQLCPPKKRIDRSIARVSELLKNLNFV